MENKESQSAKNGYKFFLFIHSLFEKEMSDMLAVMTDKCDETGVLPSQNGSSFSRYHSHCFN